MKYPLAKPHIGKKEEHYALEALRSGVLSIGPKVEAFEERFARFVGTKHAVAVSSGTAGLHLALIAAGIKEDLRRNRPDAVATARRAVLPHVDELDGQSAGVFLFQLFENQVSLPLD